MSAPPNIYAVDDVIGNFNTASGGLALYTNTASEKRNDAETGVLFAGGVFVKRLGRRAPHARVAPATLADTRGAPGLK